MSPPPRLIEPRLVRLHKSRAATGFATNAFLHARAADDLCERLEAIPRRFARALVLGGGATFFEALAKRPDLAARVESVVHGDVTPALLAPDGVCVEADVLPFAAGAFDLIVSPLLLHWANDLVGALVQLQRALRPDGLMLATLFGAGTLVELRQALIEAELEARGGASARIAPFGDVMTLAGLLQRAGFALPAADRDVVTVRYDTVLALLRDLRAMGETNALSERARPLTRGLLADLNARYRAQFGDGGRVRATFELVTLTGWAPHASQQRPLKPGSARTRLAEALGVQETPLPAKED